MRIEWIKHWLRWEEVEPPRGFVARLVRRYLLWNNDWYGSHAIRYLPIARLLKLVPNDKSLHFLEVGSADRGIVPFLKRRVIAVDLAFDREGLRRTGALLLPVRGKIEHLPFPDASFDAVLAVDVFEHLPAFLRPKAVLEMVRVARRYVVIAVPCGERVAEMEMKLDQYHRRRFGISNRWLVEHQTNGLPNLAEVCQVLRVASPQGTLSVIGNAPLPLWYALEAFEIAVPRNYLRRILTGWLVSLASRWNARNPYRRIFVLELPRSALPADGA